MNVYREATSIEAPRSPASWWHRRIAHRFGWFFGRVETWWAGPALMVGFRCITCGVVTDVHEGSTVLQRLGSHGSTP